MLWLGSRSPTQSFPDFVKQAGQELEIGRETANGPDVRGFKVSLMFR